MPKTSKTQRTPASVTDDRVLGALLKLNRPASAYELLELLRVHGVTGPPTVYRALKRLQAAGSVHRLESLNAFVACEGGKRHSIPPAFAICRECGSAEEFLNEAAVAALDAWAQIAKFEVGDSVIELHGRCGNCAEKAKER